MMPLGNLAKATVRVGRGAPAPTWTALDGCGDVEFPNQMPEDLDVSHQNSPGLTEENIPGWLPAVDWAVEIIVHPGNDTDEVLQELNERDEASKEFHLLEIGMANETRTYMVYLKGYDAKKAVKPQLMATATWRVMARVANAAP